MTRSVLQPIRTRRVFPNPASPSRPSPNVAGANLSPATRKTLAAIGTLWISFASSSSAMPRPRQPDVAAHSSDVTVAAPPRVSSK